MYVESMCNKCTSVMCRSVQEADVVLDIHILGANVTFFGGIVYCFMQSVMTYRMIPFYNGRCICHLRLAISLLSASCLTISILASR